MKLILLPLAFSVAYIAYENRDRIIDQYMAAYPVSPAKEAALARCISETADFNRLDGDDRQSCYRKYGVAPAVGDSCPPQSMAAPVIHTPALPHRSTKMADNHRMPYRNPHD